MTSLAEFHRQRARVVVPKAASTRRVRRAIERKLRLAGQPRRLNGVVSRDDRHRMGQHLLPIHERHRNVMDPFVLPTYRHPQARRLERVARRIAYEDVGWRIEFDDDGVMHHIL